MQLRFPSATSKSCGLSALGLLLAGLSSLSLNATRPPTPKMIEEYRNDGTLEQRIEAAKEMGNHKIDPNLVEHANYRTRRMAIERFGTPEQRAEFNMAPPPAWRGMPTKGDVNVLVLCIDFNDFNHNENKNAIPQLKSRILGDGDSGSAYPYESLRNFYRRSSYNQLEIKGSVLGWYRPKYSRVNIQKTQSDRQALIKEALEYYDKQGHDFSQYDNNGDGEIDYLAVIWSGPHQGWGSFWWAYQTSWNDRTTPLTVDGKSISKYSWQFEYEYTANSNGSLPPIDYYTPGTLIHETGHALGLPDYYDYDPKVGPQGGVGGWDMMDGSAGDHNCYSKFLLDWITPDVATSAQAKVQLHGAADSGDALIVMPDASTEDPFGEYFMVQNRQKTGNDTRFAGTGLMVWHVDSRLDNTGKDYIYDNSWTDHKLLRLMEADGLEEIEQNKYTDAEDFYVQGASFGAKTKPSNVKYDGSYNNLGFNNISPSASIMSFDVTDESSPAPLTIKTQPISQKANVGDPVKFSVQASGGKSPYTYTWYKNNVAISGANTATYSFTASASDINSTFHAVVKDGNNKTATSEKASLTGMTPSDGELIKNGGFEEGAASWSGTTSAIGSHAKQKANEGIKCAWLGGKGKRSTETLSQTVSIAKDSAKASFSFAMHVDSAERTQYTGYDRLALTVKNQNGRILKTLATYSNLNSAAGYKVNTFDLSAYKGQTIQLIWEMKEDNSNQTSFVIDNVSLKTK